MKAPRFWDQDGLTARLLAPASLIWKAGASHQRRVARPETVPAPVICVGNAVVGGAGKTPVAIDLTKRLVAMGRRPALLSRGYGGYLPGPVRVDRTGTSPPMSATSRCCWRRWRRRGFRATGPQERWPPSTPGPM